MKITKKAIAILLMVTLIVAGMLQPATVSATVKMESNGQKHSLVDGNGLELEYTIESSWPDAFNGRITLKNTTSQTIENWAIQMTFNHEIRNIWDAEVMEQKKTNKGYEYIIKNPGWSADIRPESSVTFGFTANWKDTLYAPDAFQLMSGKETSKDEDTTIEFRVTSDWGSAFNGEIAITNHTDKAIENWTLEFDFEPTIEQFWTAKIVEHSNGHYIIKHDGYNTTIKAGEMIRLGFSATPGNVTDQPRNYKLIRSELSSETKKDYKDSDSDWLPDFLELEWGLDPNNKDTDGDGLPDGYLFLTGTDPTMLDSDENGILDGDEDLDQDGYTNLEEYKMGTRPDTEDSDGDELLDKEEIEIYHTDPLLYDTDGDGIEDGDEINLKLNPLSKHTKDGILDSEVTFSQTLEEDFFEGLNDDNPYQLSIDLVAAGNAKKSAEVWESNYSAIFQENPAVIGKVISFDYPDLKLEKAELHFRITSKEEINSSRNFPNEKGFEGIKRYQIFRYDEDDIFFYPVQTKFDIKNNTLTTVAEEKGEYCIIDMDKWIYALGIPFADSEEEAPSNKQQKNTKSSSQSKQAAKEKDEVIQERDKLPANYKTVKLNQIKKAVDKIVSNETSEAKAYFTKSGVNKQIDLVFAIDTSKSMEAKIESSISYMKKLVNQLYQNNITARVAVVSFVDYNIKNKVYQMPNGSVWAQNADEAYQLISQVKVGGGKNENHVDALYTVSQLPFRNHVTKFAVLLTDEPLNKDHNKLNIGAKGIGKDLGSKKIITSVVCHNSHSGTFQPIWDQTNGIQVSINSNYVYYLEEFIKTVMRKDNRFQVVIQNALIPITLDETPSKSSTADTDGDTIPDRKEIDWTLIKLDKTNLLLPTLQQCADYYGSKHPEQFNRLVKEKKEVINSIVVLPIKSNPASKDGDQDGYEDTDDPRPIKSDVTITKLKDDKFVPIEDGDIVYYGGNQEWYKDYGNKIGEDGGCGTVAASNMMAYLARQNKSLKNLYAYNTTKITKSDFQKHMNTMYQYVTPKSVFNQPLGVWPLSHLTSGVKKFAKDRKVTLKANNLDIWDYKKMAAYMRTGLQKNSPIAIMIGVNPKLEDVYTYNPNGKDWSQSYNLHWVTVTALKEDQIAGKSTLLVSTWGCYAYIDLDDYMDEDLVPPQITYFTKK